MARTSLLLLCALAFGCTKQPAEETRAPAPAPEAPEAPAAPVDKAGPSVVRPEYAIALHPEAEGYTAGELAQFELVLEGRGGWHLNQEFPITVELGGPGSVTFAKTRLEKPDAAAFGDESARFAVAFTPAEAGEQPVGAHVSFAMCTDENCIMHEERLALTLAVR